MRLDVLAIAIFAALLLLRLAVRRYNAAAMALFRDLLHGGAHAADVAAMHERVAQLTRGLQGRHALPAEVDLVVSGGGFKVCVAGGLILVLQHLGVRVRRVAGTSAGAQVAFLATQPAGMDSGLQWAMAVAATLARFPLMFPGPMWHEFYGGAARRAAEVPPPGTFRVCVTAVERWLPLPRGRRVVWDAYLDREQVADALIATGTVPLLMRLGLTWPLGPHRCVDGGLTDNCPVFRDGARPQLVLCWDELPPALLGKFAGLYLTADEMRALAHVGVDAAVELARGAARAPCMELHRPGEPLPACGERYRETIGVGDPRALAELGALAGALGGQLRPRRE